MSIYNSIKDLPKIIGKTYRYQSQNSDMIVTVSRISDDSYGSIYTFDYKSVTDGKICYFFIASSNEPSPFPILTQDKTWQKWTTIE
jgi:hypothetical protein